VKRRGRPSLPKALRSLGADHHVGPDVTDAVLSRLGYRPLDPRAARRLRRRGVLHTGVCLGATALALAAIAWTIDDAWRREAGGPREALRPVATISPEAGHGEAERGLSTVAESFRPLRRLVDELDLPAPPLPDGATPRSTPDSLAARAPWGET